MVEGARLESVYAGDRIVGSNPILSARMIRENFADFLFARFYVALAPKNNPNQEK